MSNKRYNLEIQIGAMRNLYPGFQALRKSVTEVLFRGNLLVKPEMPVYKVSVLYRGSKSPLVKVIKPELVDNAPHIYPGSSTLCLYHPRNYKWKRENLVAREIMGWTTAWIYFYEVWLQKGKWYGPEAPHDIEKKQENE